MGSLCFPLARQKKLLFFAGVLIPAKISLLADGHRLFRSAGSKAGLGVGCWRPSTGHVPVVIRHGFLYAYSAFPKMQPKLRNAVQRHPTFPFKSGQPLKKVPFFFQGHLGFLRLAESSEVISNVLESARNRQSSLVLDGWISGSWELRDPVTLFSTTQGFQASH